MKMENYDFDCEKKHEKIIQIQIQSYLRQSTSFRCFVCLLFSWSVDLKYTHKQTHQVHVYQARAIRNVTVT